MQTSSKAKHLGTLITERGNPAEEIRRRVTATMPVLRHLDIFRNIFEKLCVGHRTWFRTWHDTLCTAAD